VAQPSSQTFNCEDLALRFQFDDSLDVLIEDKPLRAQLKNLLDLWNVRVYHDSYSAPLLDVGRVINILLKPEVLLKCMVRLRIEPCVAINDYCLLDKDQITTLDEVVNNLGVVNDVFSDQYAILVEATAHTYYYF
jgi:hypothetical protein